MCVPFLTGQESLICFERHNREKSIDFRREKDGEGEGGGGGRGRVEYVRRNWKREGETEKERKQNGREFERRHDNEPYL